MNASIRSASRIRTWPQAAGYGFQANRDDGDESGGLLPFGATPKEGEDLPYKVELWNDEKLAVEQVLAVTANSSIGYAAYFGATREYAGRYITLRHKNRILSSWNGPNH
ncbi:MAG TPA: hypothetical protein VGG12_08535 [Methylovirgula sp.]|jgi:hypothetical protein